MTLAVYKSDGSVLWQVQLGTFQAIGIPVVADVDASGRPSIVIPASTSVCAIDYRGNYKWCYDAGSTAGVSNLRSGVAASVYDLEGNGIPEVIVPLRGGKVLFLDGATGSLKNTFDVAQAIASPYTLDPQGCGAGIVVDVDGSGHAAIVTVWGDTPGVDPIVIINGQGNTWQPARSIWNQAMFYDGNISDAGEFPQHFTNSFASPTTNAFAVQSPVGTPVDPVPIRQTTFTYTASDGTSDLGARDGDDRSPAASPTVAVPVDAADALLERRRVQL